MMNVAGHESAPHDAQESYWSDDLPQAALERLLTQQTVPTFDEIVVDEAQDVIRSQYLDVLDVSLRGGLAAGRWRFFGDFERQAIFGQDAEALEGLIQHRANDVAHYGLRINCRNTPRIAEFAQLLGGLDPHYRRVLRSDDGIEPELFYYRDENGQDAKLTDSLARLYAEGYQGSDIVVLSVRAHDSCAIQMRVQPWRDRLRPFGADGPPGIGYCSIHAFKGLEARAIVVTDVEQIDTPAAQALFYVATTRALHRLVILARESVREQARAIVRLHLERPGEA
jgi:superfamily I DNA/RNA helicase